MRKDKESALKVIRRFFKIGYDITDPDFRNPEKKFQGLFISDCGVIWSQATEETEESKLTQFNVILQIVQEINKAVLEDGLMKRQNIMLKNSVAYGEFEYIDTHKHDLIRKEMIFGDAYIRAFDDNSMKLDPGLCRIVIDKKFPDEIKTKIDGNSELDNLSSLIRKKQNKYYFFWNCHSNNEIDGFWNEYMDSKKEVYKKMYSALSRYTGPQGN